MDNAKWEYIVSESVTKNPNFLNYHVYKIQFVHANRPTFNAELDCNGSSCNGWSMSAGFRFASSEEIALYDLTKKPIDVRFLEKKCIVTCIGLTETDIKGWGFFLEIGKKYIAQFLLSDRGTIRVFYKGESDINFVHCDLSQFTYSEPFNEIVLEGREYISGGIIDDVELEKIITAQTMSDNSNEISESIEEFGVKLIPKANETSIQYARCIDEYTGFTIGKIYQFPCPIDDDGSRRSCLTTVLDHLFKECIKAEYEEQTLNEALQFAITTFKIGTRYKSVGRDGRPTQNVHVSDEIPYLFGNSIAAGKGQSFIWSNGKWATIIEKPVDTPFEMPSPIPPTKINNSNVVKTAMDLNDSSILTKHLGVSPDTIIKYILDADSSKGCVLIIIMPFVGSISCGSLSCNECQLHIRNGNKPNAIKWFNPLYYSEESILVSKVEPKTISVVKIEPSINIHFKERDSNVIFEKPVTRTTTTINLKFKADD